MLLHDAIGINCRYGATTEKSRHRCQVYGLRGVCCWLFVCYLTWHDYSSLVEGESHGILLIFHICIDITHLLFFACWLYPTFCVIPHFSDYHKSYKLPSDVQSDWYQYWECRDTHVWLDQRWHHWEGQCGTVLFKTVQSQHEASQTAVLHSRHSWLPHANGGEIFHG